LVAESPMNQKEILIKLLHRLSESLELATASEIEELLSGRAFLAISKENPLSRNPRKRETGLQKRDQRNLKHLGTIVVQLRRLESRNEGWSLLDRAQLTKKDLEDLARLMDLPVSREDDAERLRQKIVQESIGARLDSQAIRGS
jgi:hypothetical protein